MKMTLRQIQATKTTHRRRLRVLQNELGYPEDHPMVAWHLGKIAELERQEVESRGGNGTGLNEVKEDKELPGVALAP